MAKDTPSNGNTYLSEVTRIGNIKERQQVITAGLPRSQLNNDSEFAPIPLYYYCKLLNSQLNMPFNELYENGSR